MKTTFLTTILVLLSLGLFAQVGVNNDGSSPDGSAMLDVKSITKGMLVPRMTTAQRTTISSPATGLLVFDETTGGFWFYNGTSWVSLSDANHVGDEIADADNDTKIKVEESADEDIIRFDMEGTEFLKMQNGRLDVMNTGGSVFLGELAGFSDDHSNNLNTAVGSRALFSNTTGNNNTADGHQSLYSNTTGYKNTANGKSALYHNTTGYSNTANGSSALYSNTTGFGNAANGTLALYYNTTGNNNTANGKNALYHNTTGYLNTANGISALYYNTTGYKNTANGSSVLHSNTTGNNNTAIGSVALYSNTYGSYNTALGTDAQEEGISASYNVSVGHRTLAENETAVANAAVGYSALEHAVGSGNTALGYSTGPTATSLGSSNTFVGRNAGFSGGATINYSTALGEFATVTATDQIRIGNNFNTSIGGYQPWSNLSDGRMKKNVLEDVPGLDMILRLRAVSYELDHETIIRTMYANDEKKIAERISEIPVRGQTRRQTGFIAQEVEAIAQEIGYDFSGIDAPKNNKDTYSLRYAEFVVPLVKAVQELADRNELLEDRIGGQQAMIEEQKAINEELISRIGELEKSEKVGN